MYDADILHEFYNSNMRKTVVNKLLSSISVFITFLLVINTASEKVVLVEVIEPSLAV